jgi:HSP20 family protein
MWEDDDNEEEAESVENLGNSGPRAIRLLIEDALFGEERPFFDLKSGSLRPLCRIEATEEAVTVTFDLPYVEKNDISLTSTENTLNVEAKMRKAITLRVGGSVQKYVEFERYTRRIRLPTKVEPERAKATFRNGLLRVKFPIAKRGSRVRIR